MAVKALTCSVCDTSWNFEHRRGRLPSMCPDCKADPKQVKVKQQLDSAALKAAADHRIDILETALKANGSHLSQPRRRISYSIAELEDRIYQLELWKAEVNGNANAESEELRVPQRSRPVEPVDAGPEVVRRRPRRKAKAS